MNKCWIHNLDLIDACCGWCIAQLIWWLHFQWPDLFLSANCSRLSSQQGNVNLSGHVAKAGLFCACGTPPINPRWRARSVRELPVCAPSACELSPCPIDGSHMTTVYKAASPLKWNTCSAVRQVLFYNSSKNKSVLQRYCFVLWGSSLWRIWWL